MPKGPAECIRMYVAPMCIFVTSSRESEREDKSEGGGEHARVFEVALVPPVCIVPVVSGVAGANGGL